MFSVFRSKAKTSTSMLMPMGFHATKVTQWHKVATAKPGDQIHISTFPRSSNFLLIFSTIMLVMLMS
jgi:hypothetical protein